MKLPALFLIFAALLTLPAAAEIIGVEQFDYPDGAIVNQSGGTFWDFSNITAPVHDGTPSLWQNNFQTPTVASGRLVTSNSHALRPHNGPTLGFGSGSDEENGSVTDGRLQQVVYSRVSVTTGATVPSYLGISAYDFGIERIFFGKESTKTVFSIQTLNGFGVQNTGVTVDADTTYLLVSKVDYVNNRVSFWINPSLGGAEPAPNAVINGYTTDNFTTGVRLASGGGGAAVRWDDLIVATSWAEISGTVVTTLVDQDDGPTSLNTPADISLREAVKYSPTGSLITFAPGLSGQTITLTHAEGDMEIPGALTIDATALPGGLTVNGNNTSRHFFVGTGKSLTLRGLTLTGGNSSTNPGGAISNDGVLNLFRCTLRGNTGTAGTMSAGGAVFSTGQLRAEDCSFIHNTTPGLGGAIFLLHGGADLIRCTLAGNTAELGGALWVQGFTTATLSHCTVSGNHSSGNASGGGCVAIGGTLNLLHCTVSQNTGNGGGGLYLTTPASVHVHSSIIAGNSNPSGGPADIHKLSGTLTNSGANLIGSNESVASEFPASPSPGIPALGSYVGTATSPLDSKLSPLGYFGGPVQTMHPLIGSLAIDNAGPTDPGGTDARGFPRFVDGDGNGIPLLDIGAVEAGNVISVTTSVDEDNGPGGVGRSLREALAVSTAPGSRIRFSPSLFIGTITLALGELAIPATPGLFIDASNIPGGVSISGANTFRVFNIPATATVAMHSLKITNGRAPSGAPITLLDSSGGGILNKGTCSVFFSTISGNSANFIGGGIGNLGICTVHSSTLSGNTAPFGGGGIYNNGTCTVISSTITGHSVQIGGGIYNEGTCSVISSTLSGNSATTSGGGIFTSATTGTFHLSSSIVAGNTAPSRANLSADTLASNINNLTSGDPLLVPLGDYGGPTQTMPPLPGSPAIDAAGPVSEVQQVAISALPAVFTLTFNGATTGSLNQFLTASEVANALQNLSTIGSGNVSVEKTNNSGGDTFFSITFVGARGGLNQPQLISNNGAAQVTTVLDGSPGSPLATDQRGFRRPRDGDGNGTALPDLGAVESSIALVTTLANTGTGSLRAAVEEVAAQPGADTIFFASALSGGTITLGTQIIITDPAGVTIDATALSGGLTLNGGNTSRHFTVQTGSLLTLRGLTLSGGNNGAGTIGGSIVNTGTLHLFRCVLTRNTSVAGGAILSVGTLECQDSTFFENTATGSGGALYLNSDTGSAVFTRCTFTDNTAPDGGAIMHVGAGPTSFTHCTIAGNRSTAEGSGAGFSVRNGFVTLAHCTVSQNVGNNGSGGLLLQAPATVNVVFSIIAENADLGGTQPDISMASGTLNGFGVNLIGNNSSVEAQFPVGSPNAQGNYVGTGATPLNAKLSPLGSFGGPVQTMHPLIGSPAIDTAGPVAPIGVDVDARGFPRLIDGDASGLEQLDIGAVEAGPLLTVTSNAASGDNSLRTRIIQGALTLTGARIGFSPSVFPAQTILLDGDTEIVIPATPGLFIDASNLSAPVTISGNNATRVFNIIQGATVAMHSLKIVNGTAFEGADGGGILNEGTCTVMSCTLSGNSASTGGGGAIGNIGTLALMQSTLSGNLGLLGGAVYNGGPAVVTQCTFANNFGGLRGGAIENLGPMVLTQCTLAGNSAATDAGAILNFNQLTLNNSIVAGNNSPGSKDVLMSGGTISPIGVNFIGLPAGSTLSASPTLLTGNPLLAPLGDYGGRTQTMPPLRGSPAIDAATTTASQTDQRGGSRSRDGDGDFIALPDIGAVEASLVFVSTTADAGPGSLRAAIAEAAAQPGADTIFFTPIFVIPSFTTDILLADEIVIDDPAGVTLDASDLPTGVIIDAGPGANRHFRITAGTTTVFQRLKLTGGNGGGGGAPPAYGGSIFNGGNLTLRECTLANNSTGVGGAIYNQEGLLTIERSTLHGNTATNVGGAIHQESLQLLTLTACTIANNTAGFEAGAISAPFARPVLLTHCTITGNTVTLTGGGGVGGVRGVPSGSVTVRDSIISGNTDANSPGTPNINAGFISQGNNLIGGDPKLAPLNAYGGPTFTAPPVPGSPAIDAAVGSTITTDQRGLPIHGLPDIGAAEYQGTPDLALYWYTDWDEDGSPFGMEFALGTDPFQRDPAHTANLFLSGVANGQPFLRFGRNPAANSIVTWRLTRSTTLDPGSFDEIFSYHGPTQTISFVPQTLLLTIATTGFDIIDLNPPSPKAFYRIEAKFEP